MKYVDEFRDPAAASAIAGAIREAAGNSREFRLMEFCGGHTHAVSRYGIPDLLPPSVTLIHGPGCPVCVLPIGRIDQAIRLALDPRVTLCTYGDALRVPASGKDSLLKAKARGADVRLVYSPLDAVRIAMADPGREVVFMAIGFETTTPPTAVAVLQARAAGLTNFSVLCNHVLTPPAMRAILANERSRIDGILGPAHVSTVIGSAPYERLVRELERPVVISGFEPLDVMRAVWMLVRQLSEGRCEVENEFTRAVTPEGNVKAQGLVEEVFTLRPSFEWRGLGTLERSALRLRDGFAAFDAECRFDAPHASVPDHKACECAAVLRGEKRPEECRIFGTGCTPENPIGACMVSSEGACAAHYTYGRFRSGR
ncbi:MAG: hypothetical protein RIS35_2925 [Pseudomonadota bacterium]